MRKKINILLSGLIAILSGCNTPKKAIQPTNVASTLYGIPYATYHVSGKVVNSKNKPIKNTPVVIKGYSNQIMGDTLYTNTKGQFETTVSAFPTTEVNIVVTNPTNQQPLDSVQHPATYTRKTAGSGFYRGECNIQTEIKIK